MTSTIRLTIEGMHCASCVNRLESSLKSCPSIKATTVNLPQEWADIEYQPDLIDLEGISKLIEKTGYRSRPYIAPAPVTKTERKQAAPSSITPRILAQIPALIWFLSKCKRRLLIALGRHHN